MKNLKWLFLIIIIIAAIFVLQSCGSDEANVDAQEFINDFGSPIIYFHTADCHHKLVVSDNPNIWTFYLNGNDAINLHGVDRNVIHDVGIEYSTDNFSLIKHFDGRITLDYMTEHCEITMASLQ